MCNCLKNRKGARTAEDWMELAIMWDKKGFPERAERLRKIAETTFRQEQKEKE